MINSNVTIKVSFYIFAHFAVFKKIRRFTDRSFTMCAYGKKYIHASVNASYSITQSGHYKNWVLATGYLLLAGSSVRGGA